MSGSCQLSPSLLPTQVAALSSSVTVRGRRLLVDGAPFTVRGVNYSPG